MSLLNPVLFVRESQAEEQEIMAASHSFPVYGYPNLIPKGSLVIGRYSVLPFYQWVDESLRLMGSQLINSYEQHRYIADFEYYRDVEDLTFKTWFNPQDLKEEDAPFVIKGKTNSRKSDWNGVMFAKTKRDAIAQGCELQKDSLIGQQDLIYRKYVPLRTYEIGVNGLPFTDEWRVFVYRDQVLSYAYYWSNAERAEDLDAAGPRVDFLDFVNKVIARVKDHVNFYVLDVAMTQEGQWVLVEINDAQMSGLSMNNPGRLYARLKMALCPTPNEMVLGVDIPLPPGVPTSSVSDGYHTFEELYKFRKLYNAILFNQWAKLGLYEVHKSKKHHSGEECFGGGYFVVVALLPSGQITNHYELKDWDLFKIPETGRALFAYDGHSSVHVCDRLTKLLIGYSKEPS